MLEDGSRSRVTAPLPRRRYGAPVGRHSRTVGLVLLAAAAWTAVVWVTRLVNLAGEDRSAGFVAVHAGLAAVSLLLAAPVAWVGWRLVQRQHVSREP
jgi:hypothetical protein